MEQSPGRGFRSGPVAAALATVAVLAATALPGPPKLTPAAPAAAVVTALTSATIPALDSVGTLRLGGSLATYELDLSDAAPTWLDRADGTVSLHVRLASMDGPPGALEGILNLRGAQASTAFDLTSRSLFAATVPSIEGVEPRLEAVDSLEAVDVYTSLSGTLVGEGALEGAVISIRNVPDTLLRRGPWSTVVDGEVLELDDTVFGRLVWLRESGAADVDLEDHGRGTLGLRVVSAH